MIIYKQTTFTRLFFSIVVIKELLNHRYKTGAQKIKRTNIKLNKILLLKKNIRNKQELNLKSNVKKKYFFFLSCTEKISAMIKGSLLSISSNACHKNNEYWRQIHF